MYITYDTNQIGYGQPPPLKTKKQRDNNTLPFRPTWLIRTSDWVKVPGKEVTQKGYCALSYAWTWSGEKFMNEATGHPEVKDEGKHKIITTFKKEDDDGTTVSRNVKFENLLQQICQDFKVEYLWFDRWCVDINNEEEKVESLKQMYLTYSHADYAIALVPEMETLISNNKKNDQEDISQQESIQVLEDCLDQILRCEWTKRVWLLVEAMMSKRLLFLGKDVHLWSDGLNQYASSFINPNSPICLEAIQSLSGQQKDACKVLWHAHRRDTTFDHDRIFALINIYSSSANNTIGRDMPITYEPALEDYMIQFYKRLIMVDWTVLCFGKQQIGYPNEMAKFATFMPSWTGVSGTHLQHAMMSQLSQKGQERVTLSDVHDTNSIQVRCKSLSLNFVNQLTKSDDAIHVVSIQEKQLEKRYGVTFTHQHKEILFSLTQEKDVEKCIILDISFIWQECVIRPVIVKNNEHYQSIGISCIPYQNDQKMSLDNFGLVSSNHSVFIIQ